LAPASYGSTVAAFRGDGYWSCDQNTHKPKSGAFFLGTNRLPF